MRSIAFVGIDVQVARRCAFAVIDSDLGHSGSGWFDTPVAAAALVQRLRDEFGRVAIGIDAPRRPLEKPREYYWSGRGWRPRRPSDRGHGRHCEVVVAAYGIANPQWTPLRGACPGWMVLGFELFSTLSEGPDVYEVFPSASYKLLAEAEGARLEVSLSSFGRGPKDMLDAYVAAFTVHEFLAGRGTKVGGGDGLGTIALPRGLPAGDARVLAWPGAAHGGPPRSYDTI